MRHDWPLAGELFLQPPNYFVNSESTQTHYFLDAYVDKTGEVSLSEIVQDTSFIEISEASHVFNFLELWRVHLLSVADVHLDLL